MFFNGYDFPGGAAQKPRLEVIRRGDSPGRKPPLLFVHGAYTAAWCWDEHFLPYFAGLGYTCHALSLRGHGGSGGGESLHFHGLADYVDDLGTVIDALPEPPIVIGHSMGGMVVQKYLERHPLPGVVLMASVPPAGLGNAVLRLMMTDPVLFGQVSLMHAAGPDAVDLRTAGRAVFSERIGEPLLASYARRMQGESQRALLDMTFGSLPVPAVMDVPPMLVLAAGDDALFSRSEAKRTAKAYGADLHVVPDMAHAMMLEPDWEQAAAVIARWLLKQTVAA